jgi:hypothetical protein
MTSLGLELLIWSSLNLRDDLKSPSLHLKCNERLCVLKSLLSLFHNFYTQESHSTLKKGILHSKRTLLLGAKSKRFVSTESQR